MESSGKAREVDFAQGINSFRVRWSVWVVFDPITSLSVVYSRTRSEKSQNSADREHHPLI